MARPLRIEYPNAIYHVMNRGGGRKAIFHDARYTEKFLTCLAEAHAQFGLEILAYCLMDNHYHLLVRTPRGNLSRCMRHINGTYTQRYNKLKRSDGSIFRGRYRAIVVDRDEYLLPVSRYIHRNPIETKKPLVRKLEDFALSSYGAYINQTKAPTWLNRELVLSVLNSQQRFRAYRAYVNHENEPALLQFYDAKKQASVLGSKAFADKIERFTVAKDAEISGDYLANPLTFDVVINIIAKHFAISVNEILRPVIDSRAGNKPRQIAMYLTKKHCDMTLLQLGSYFSLGNYSTISKQAKRFDVARQQNQVLQKELAKLEQKLLSLVKT